MLKIDLIVCKLNGTALIQFLPLLQYRASSSHNSCPDIVPVSQFYETPFWKHWHLVH